MSLMYLPHLDVFCDLLERLPPVKLISNQDKILWKTLLRRNVFKNSQRKGVVVGEEENSSSFFQFSRARLTRDFVDVFEKNEKIIIIKRLCTG